MSTKKRFWAAGATQKRLTGSFLIFLQKIKKPYLGISTASTFLNNCKGTASTCFR